MNNKKEQEREELHKTIWKIANELRGSVDGWDFKQYVLGLLFYRFISENIEHYVNENQRKAGIEDFEYRNISDEQALMGKSQILEEKGLFDDFTIDNKLGNTVDERNEKLVKLLNAIGDLKLGDYYDNNIDLFQKI